MKPTITFIAGPNGSGKSTLTSGNLDFFSNFPLLDPDALANTVHADNQHKSLLSAGREVLEIIQRNLRDRRAFAVETTLSGKLYLETMLKAKRLGFEVALVYVGTNDVNINVSRVAKRVKLDGHHVPEIDIRRRYQRSLDNLLIAAHRVDLAILFDNSRPILSPGSAHSYDLVGLIRNGIAHWNEPLPSWAEPLKSSFS